MARSSRGSEERQVDRLLNDGDGNFYPGVIEGFFGKSWDWAARLDCIDFLRETGYRFYIYAPKNDSYLRRRWCEPLPTVLHQHLANLSTRCRVGGIDFGIGLTPFEAYLRYDAAARSALQSKVRQINEMGAPILCILFDDMRGDIEGIVNLQARLIGDICEWSTARQFIVAPTYYSDDPRLAQVFGPPPPNYLRKLSALIDPRIDLFWTGERVISNGYSVRHLSDVAAEMGRRPFIWDNHISNDSRLRTQHLYLDPSTDGWDLPRDHIAGLAINPMNQAYLSRIALAGYARLWAGTPRLEILRTVVRGMFSPPFGDRLLADQELFQKNGLDMGDTRRRLLDWYRAQADNPYAGEIAAWLEGKYAFDPNCLTA